MKNHGAPAFFRAVRIGLGAACLAAGSVAASPASLPVTGAGWAALYAKGLPAVAQVTRAQNGVEFEALVQCRALLADHDWAQRIWPETNSTPKPTRRELLPDVEIRAQVDDLLRKESALRALYGLDLDAKALQTEMNRIAIGMASCASVPRRCWLRARAARRWRPPAAASRR